jgi:hypothetical protein
LNKLAFFIVFNPGNVLLTTSSGVVEISDTVQHFTTSDLNLANLMITEGYYLLDPKVSPAGYQVSDLNVRVTLSLT